MQDNSIIKVSSKSPVMSTAGCIVKSFEQAGYKVQLELRAIGASSVNQLLKSAAVARGILSSKGYDLVLRPSFDEDRIQGEQRTVMVVRLSLNKQ